MIYVQPRDLVIEVTRRCNMNCAHCIRGDAENMDINPEYLEFLTSCVNPMSVTFTGGEPSLNIEAIKQYFRRMKEKEHGIYNFYVVTNGKENQEELALTLLRAYPDMEEPEYCGLALSIDQFHETPSPKDYSIFEGLSFFNKNDKTHNLNKVDDRWVICTGRASNNGIGCRSPKSIVKDFDEWIEDWYYQGDDIVVEVEMLYVSANGNILNDCDLSYDDIDNYPICHIYELQEMLEQYIQEVEGPEQQNITAC